MTVMTGKLAWEAGGAADLILQGRDVQEEGAICQVLRDDEPLLAERITELAEAAMEVSPHVKALLKEAPSCELVSGPSRKQHTQGCNSKPVPTSGRVGSIDTLTFDQYWLCMPITEMRQ